MNKILVIDDNKALNFIIKSIFKKNNFAVDFAYNGLDGLKLLRENDYDALITDMNLPDISGMEILRSIQELPLVKVLVAAYVDESKLKELKKLNAMIIEKPFSNDDLLETVQSRLG